MTERRAAYGQLRLFAVLASLGLLAELLKVRIPHTEVFIEGRWVFGLIGFALLRRPWAAFLLAGILALPFISDVPLWVGFLGNMLYAAPSLLIVRYAHPRLLRRWGPGWTYGLSWFVLVLALYQAFFTPAIWAVIALLENGSLGHRVIEGWRSQPYLVESILVALVSASLLVTVLTVRELRRKQERLDLINHLLMAVRRINQVIVQEESAPQVAHTACRHLVESGIFRQAWIVLTATGETPFLTTAEIGSAGEPTVTCRSVPSADLPACIRQALDTAGTADAADARDAGDAATVKTPSRPCPTCAPGGEVRGGSQRAPHFRKTNDVCLSRILSAGAKIQGALAVRLAAREGCRRDVRSLFEEIAGDLAFALQRIEAASQLQDSEEQYRALAMQSADCLLLHDLDGRILDVNPASCRTYGYSREELLTMRISDLDPDYDERAEGGRFYDQIQPGEPVEFEVRQRTRAGRIFPAEVRLSLITLGGQTLIQGLCRDITERQETERRLRENEHRFRSFVENANDIVYALSPDGVFTYVSPNWIDFVGEPAEEALGQPFEPYVHPEDRARCREFLDKVIHSGAKQRSVEYRVKHADGSWRWHVSNGSPIHSEDGTVTQYAGIARDVTDHKHAEEKLRRSEARYRSLAESFPDGALFIIDREQRYVAANGRGLAKAGLSSEDIVGRTVREAFPEIWDTLERNIRRALAGERVYYEVEYQGRIYSNQAVILSQRESVPEHVMIITQDITARVRAKEEHAHLQAQLLQAQKMESVGRLAGGVAHDFNNMLNVILGYVDLLLDDLPPDSSLRNELGEIRRAASRSSDLTRQLLAFARRQTVAPRVLDLNETIHGTLQMLRRLIGEDIDLLWKPALELDPIRVDPAQIDQLLANLIVNARDAIGTIGGKVTIETRQATLDTDLCALHDGSRPGGYVVLSVSDNGRGMDEETRAHIFEPFFTTKGVGEGTGLGLATVYGIVRQNEGFIHVESEPGRGTRFDIHLPVCSVEPTLSPARAGEGMPPAPNHETVLLVEDEPAILTLGAKMLAKLGYRVLTSSCPQDALRLAGEYEGTIDLLVTDVVMPVMNGRELACRMLALYPDLRLLFMSGYTANVIADQGVLEQGVQFLEKPFSIQQLAHKVRAALERVGSLG